MQENTSAELAQREADIVDEVFTQRETDIVDEAELDIIARPRTHVEQLRHSRRLSQDVVDND